MNTSIPVLIHHDPADHVTVYEARTEETAMLTVNLFDLIANRDQWISEKIFIEVRQGDFFGTSTLMLDEVKSRSADLVVLTDCDRDLWHVLHVETVILDVVVTGQSASSVGWGRTWNATVDQLQDVATYGDLFALIMSLGGLDMRKEAGI